jgi:two-component system cell cycle sensor histidine kinase/response regulator CckA
LLPARNFYLAVHDGASGEVHFPWYADEKVEPWGLRRRGGGGVTERILRTGRPLSAGAADLQRLYEEGEIASLEPLPQYYLGVPVPGEGGRPVGVLAVQSYDPAVVLGPEHLEVLEFAAREVAHVIERLQAQEALRESEARYRLVVEGGAEAIAVIAEGKVLFANRRAGELAGLPPEELLGREAVDFVHPEDRELVRRTVAALLRGERAAEALEFRAIDASGKEHWVEVRPSAALWEGKEGVIVFLTDVSERKRLEEQYRQAQKMEGIGRLAGGMAHDFNNILTAIIGYASFALEELGEAHPAAPDIREILANAGRASELTRRLLALSRRTMLSPRALDLNELVLSLHRTLRRLLGEDIELVTLPGENLWAVRADPAQMEQVVLNLVVNARDAMPSGGKLTIETANVELDADYARGHLGVEPGQYVLLAVSDTGIGMSEEVKSHLFEPFFTTKEVGKGTGLGLATVYGIVKQHGGHIYVYSELGRGTTFKIYLPRHYGEAELLGRRDEEGFVPRGSETVLVVEDEPAVRVVEVRVLREQGYRVLEAANGVEAMRVALAHPGPIHLLVTDVVMPQMSGRELAERLRRIVPQLRVLYLSGYTDNAIVHHGVLDEGVAFLQKPFTASALARKVREVLDS